VKLVTSFENPPIPWRKYDWIAYDEDQMSGICSDPDCNCRNGLVRGWGATEMEAITEFVSRLLDKYDIPQHVIACSKRQLEVNP